MGLSVPQYPIFNGAAFVACYVNVRRLEQSKEKKQVVNPSGIIVVEEYYTLQGLATFKNEGTYVDSLVLSLKSDTIFLDDWADVYTALKKNLDDRGISWTDDNTVNI
jgi:hypothetical protein